MNISPRAKRREDGSRLASLYAAVLTLPSCPLPPPPLRPPLCEQIFGLATQVEGVGSDTMGDFTLSGNYTDDEVYFILKYKSLYQQSRTFSGTRNRANMSIAGRWWVSDGGSPSGEFAISHEDSERRVAPSYDVERLKLYYVLERLATGGFGVVSLVRRAVDGKVLVWKELNYARMNKKVRRMMITEVNILRDIDHKHVVKQRLF